MKPVICALFSLLVLFALCSEIKANPESGGDTPKCTGTNERRCPQVLCGPDGPKGWRQQDNSKPFPQCCGGPICS